jgi:DNA-binding transcriptional MerR regulator
VGSLAFHGAMTTKRHTRKGLYKISDLARETGVPVGTIKFYIREGLLPEPTLKTGRNMAYYDRGFVDRIRCIRELQQKRFLSLGLIKAILDGDSQVISPSEVATLVGLEGKFYEAVQFGPHPAPVARVDVERRFGLSPEQISACIDLGLLAPVSRANTAQFEGDDVLLLESLGALLDAGFSQELIPLRAALPVYVEAVDSLARQELRIFSAGVTGKVPSAKIAELALAGVKHMEQLLLLVRRKRLLQAVQELQTPQWGDSTGTDD